MVNTQKLNNAACTAAQPLEGFARHEWLCFERALVVRDILVGGVRTFLKQDDARAFRRAVYRNHGMHFVAPPVSPPRKLARRLYVRALRTLDVPSFHAR